MADDAALGEEARARISDPGSAVYVSVATVWEISIKRALGKLEAPSDLLYRIELDRFEPLSMTVSHARAAGPLPRHHDDPFDRMLVAQAIQEGLTLLTRDPRMDPYGVATLQARSTDKRRRINSFRDQKGHRGLPSGQDRSRRRVLH